MKNYHELPVHVQAYLHSIELHACILRLQSMAPKDEAFQFLKNRLQSTYGAWDDVITQFHFIHSKMPIDKKALIFYYLTAGAGITKIQRLLNVGQATVYKVRDNEDYSRKNTTIEGMLATDHHALLGLQRLVNNLPILDGFRVLPKGTVALGNYSENHNNFKKEKVYTLGEEFPQ